MYIFRKKGNYLMIFFFNDIGMNEEYLFFYELKMGVVDFYIDKLVGFVKGNSFIFYVIGMNNVMYIFDLDLSKVIMVLINLYLINVIYNEYGIFLLKVIVKNVIMIEVVYYIDIIKVDFFFENIILIIVFNKIVFFLFGIVNIFIVFMMFLLFVICMFILGDFIDKKIYIKIVNIILLEFMVFLYKYLILGYYFLKMNCLNYYESIILNDFILYFYNKCFLFYGIFDCNYVFYDRLLKVYILKDLFVLSRM